jgi:hypothetical protein
VSSLWCGGVRVRRPRLPLTPGEQRVREAQLLAVLSPEGRTRFLTELGELGLTAAGWYNVFAARRWIELLAWRTLTADALLTQRLTARGAEEWAAHQLGLPPDTLRTRLRGAAVNSTDP